MNLFRPGMWKRHNGDEEITGTPVGRKDSCRRKRFSLVKWHRAVPVSAVQSGKMEDEAESNFVSKTFEKQ